MTGVVLLSGLNGLPAPAAAAEPWSGALGIRAGAVLMDIDSSFRIDSGNLGRGTTIDAEDQLSLDDEDSVYRVELDWRFARRHQISVGYFDLSRDALAVTDEALKIGNVIFPKGTAVETDFDLRLLDFSYSYSLFQNDRFEVAPLVGVYGLDFDARVNSETLGLREGEGDRFPLPTLGARAVYQLSPAWRLRASAQYFFLSYDDYEGEIMEFGASVEWNAWSNFSVGAGYSRIDMDVEDKNENGGSGEYAYDGVWAYLAVAF